MKDCMLNRNQQKPKTKDTFMGSWIDCQFVGNSHFNGFFVFSFVYQS